MKTVKYRLTNKPKKTVTAFILGVTGESTLLFVPSFDGERSDSIIIAHDDDLDGTFEDAEMNWYNVESKDMLKIGNNLQRLARKLR
jgi:hypothetical protein